MAAVKHIVVTGFSGTGSSAIIDLLKEFDNCGVPFNKKDYEDYFLTAPGALFDLEWKLLYNNDPHRSDEAFDTYMKMMTKLYKYDFRWFGGYRQNIGPQFIKNINEFVNNIAKSSDKTWYYRYKKRIFSPFRYFYRLFRYKLANKDFNLDGGYIVIDDAPIYISYPKKEEFFDAAQKLIQNYVNMISEKEITIHDHLIWPTHVHNIDKYFDDSYRFIIVHRDARDVFLTNKYLYTDKGAAGTCPLDVDEYIEYWQRLLNIGESQEHPNVKHVNFEDLIYNYEDTVMEIINFCSLDIKLWTKQKKNFNPEKSIKNTQVFTMNEVCKKEGEQIARSLPDLIYDFPYQSDTTISQMFV